MPGKEYYSSVDTGGLKHPFRSKSSTFKHDCFRSLLSYATVYINPVLFLFILLTDSTA